MRLFVAVWPPEDVLDTIAGLDRPDTDAVRWTSREQWHVTLRFLGEVEAEPEGLLDPLRALPPAQVAIGPRTERLRGHVLMIPVRGLDDLAGAVADPQDTRPFRGHLTLARTRTRGGKIPASLAGTPVTGTWTVSRVSLVRSHLGRGPARYEDLRTVELEGA